MNTLALVACVGQKQTQPAPARELYTSPWFKKACAYVESQGWPWLILSARYGLVKPEQVIEPYNLTLNRLSQKARGAWAEQVWQQLRFLVKDDPRVVILAGRYYAGVGLHLGGAGYIVETPLEGLGIGQQLKWLKEHTP
jgi:hypothetical protein